MRKGIEKHWNDHYHNFFEADFESVDKFLDTQIKEYETVDVQIQEYKKDADIDPER